MLNYPASLLDSLAKPNRITPWLFRVTLTLPTIPISPVYYFADFDTDVVGTVPTAPGASTTATYTFKSFGVKRETIKRSAKLQIDEMTIGVPNALVQFQGTQTTVGFLARSGILDQAVVDVFLWDGENPTQTCGWHSTWIVQDAKVSRTTVTLSLSTRLVQLKRQVPRTIFQAQCVAPETRLLTADLKWVRASDIVTGQRLIGFDEESTGGAAGQRRLRTGVVESTQRRTAACVEIVTDRNVLTVSADHKFLCPWQTARPLNPGLDHRKLKDGSGRKTSSWVEARHLRPGHEIKFLVVPWDDEDSFRRGYVAGMLDAEGTVFVPIRRGNRAVQIQFSQNPGPVWDAVTAELSAAVTWVGKYNVQYPGSGFLKKDGTRGNCQRLVVGGTASTMRILGMFRPPRLTAKAAGFWEGRAFGPGAFARILSVTFVGTREVVSIATSTRTFIAEGTYSHNCNNSLFDASCGLLKVNFTTSYAALSGSTVTALLFTISAAPRNGAGYYTLGRVVGTNGQNNGVARSVMQHTQVGNTATLTLLAPLPWTPQVGDTFNAVPGCDGDIGTCVNKFNNLRGQAGIGGFRGFPDVPPLEKTVG